MQRRSLAALTAALLTVSLSVAAQAPKKLRIGVEGAYPPFSEVGKDGKIKGFEIDLANALCAEMKVECTLVQQEFDGLIPALQSRKIDAIIASMSITPERQKTIAFSKAYYSTPQVFITKEGAAADISPAALKGKKIAVQSSTINETYVNALYKGSTISRYATQDQIYLDLKSGRADYTLVDKVAGEEFLKSDAGKGMTIVGPDLKDPKYFGTGVGVGMRKADAKTLGAQFNAAIDALRASGSFKKMNDQYFKYDISPTEK